MWYSFLAVLGMGYLGRGDSVVRAIVSMIPVRLASVAICMLLISACRASQRGYPKHAREANPYISSDTEVVSVAGPTLIAFDCHNANTDSDADLNELLSDFFNYLAQASPDLTRKNIRLVFRSGNQFIVLQDGRFVVVKPDTAQSVVGYYLASPHSPPKIHYGILSDIDLTEMADTYFGQKSHLPSARPTADDH